MKSNIILKAIASSIILLCGTGFTDTVLLKDTFDISKAGDINSGLSDRQTGSAATIAWMENVVGSDSYLTMINNSALRLYAKGKKTTFVKMDKDFSAVAGNIRLSVDIRNVNHLDGYSTVNLGMSSTGGFSAAAGYSFHLDATGGATVLRFFDNAVQRGAMDVSAIVDLDGFSTLVIDFCGGKTLSAAINGTAYIFETGESYTGTATAQNCIMLGWCSCSGKGLNFGMFDNLSVTALSGPVVIGLIESELSGQPTGIL